MTDWSEVQGGAVRLISSGPLEKDHYLAGLEFLLEPGWHTYWRYPGEAGIPPLVTLVDSENLKDFEILYPTPERYSDGFSESIVYHHGIVLPIRISPEDPNEKVRLSFEIFFGICSDICVPGDADLTLEFNPNAQVDKLAARLISRDLATVPNAASVDGLRVESVALSGDRLVIVANVGDASSADLFAEGPEGSFIGLPKLINHTDGIATWNLSTKGLATTKTDRKLRLVLSTTEKAVEQLVPIEPSWTN
jgi:DsbC/DsbD-like thiol-disulfide interchange protein